MLDNIVYFILFLTIGIWIGCNLMNKKVKFAIQDADVAIKKFDKLNRKYNILVNDYSVVYNDHVNLVNKYNALNRSFRKMNNDYKKIITDLEELSKTKITEAENKNQDIIKSLLEENTLLKTRVETRKSKIFNIKTIN